MYASTKVHSEDNIGHDESRRILSYSPGFMLAPISVPRTAFIFNDTFQDSSTCGRIVHIQDGHGPCVQCWQTAACIKPWLTELIMFAHSLTSPPTWG
eukprot:1161929-Pelagomonas_calceolata.AAC.11